MEYGHSNTDNDNEDEDFNDVLMAKPEYFPYKSWPMSLLRQWKLQSKY
jgi:hypothetical protein